MTEMSDTEQSRWENSCVFDDHKRCKNTYLLPIYLLCTNKRIKRGLKLFHCWYCRECASLYRKGRWRATLERSRECKESVM